MLGKCVSNQAYATRPPFLDNLHFEHFVKSFNHKTHVEIFDEMFAPMGGDCLKKGDEWHAAAASDHMHRIALGHMQRIASDHMQRFVNRTIFFVQNITAFGTDASVCKPVDLLCTKNHSIGPYAADRIGPYAPARIGPYAAVCKPIVLLCTKHHSIRTICSGL